MKSSKLRSLLLGLLAAVVMTITFRIATTSRTVHSAAPTRHTTYYSQIQRESSAHLVETALRKADLPQSLSATEQAALHLPIRMPSGVTLLPDHSLLVEAIPVVEDPSLTWDPCIGGNTTGAWTFNELMLAVVGPNQPNPQMAAEQLLMDVLEDFGQNKTIGNFTAQARASGRNFFDYWPKDPHNIGCTNTLNNLNFCLSLAQSPVHLNAIVNRIDVGQNGNSDQAGQLRFVFGVTMNPTNDDGGGVNSGNFCENSGNQDFNIILEYNVPSSITAQSWASQWANLSNYCPEPGGFTDGCAQGNQPGQFDYYLNNIISQVVLAGAGGSNAPNQSALADIRTNESELAPGANPIREMRQWTFGSSLVNGVYPLVETALTQTPDLSFDGGEVNGTMFCTFSNQNPNNNPPGCSTSLGTVEGLILTSQISIENGTFTVPAVDQAVSALNPDPSPSNPGVFWDSFPSMGNNQNLYTARVIFGASPQVVNGYTGQPDRVGGIDGTCNGCHGAETQTAFHQVTNRAATGTNDQPSALSAFLVGCNNGNNALTSPCQTPFTLNSPGNEVVQDPVYSSYHNTFGDIGRRLNCMNKITNPNSPIDVSCNGAGN